MVRDVDPAIDRELELRPNTERRRGPNALVDGSLAADRCGSWALQGSDPVRRSKARLNGRDLLKSPLSLDGQCLDHILHLVFLNLQDVANLRLMGLALSHTAKRPQRQSLLP